MNFGFKTINNILMLPKFIKPGFKSQTYQGAATKYEEPCSASHIARGVCTRSWMLLKTGRWDSTGTVGQ